jgi:hypothetical protein
MNDPDLFFIVPTYRLREVGETIKHYDEHFGRNGHSLRDRHLLVNSRV